MSTPSFTDTIVVNSPTGRIELANLAPIKAGDVRSDDFLPAFGFQMHWVCRRAEPDAWSFEGRFQGQTVTIIDIVKGPLVMTMTKRDLS